MKASASVAKILKNADELASWRADDEYLHPIDILWGIVSTTSPARQAIYKKLPDQSQFNHLKLKVAKWAALRLLNSPSPNRHLSDTAADVMQHAKQAAFKEGRNRIKSGDVLLGLLHVPDTIAFRLLKEFGITKETTPTKQ